MKMNTKKQNLIYIILLVICFCCQLLPVVLDFHVGCGPATFLWMYAILILCSLYRTRNRLLITGVVFVISFIIRYYGSFSNPFVNIIIFLIFGLIWYGLILLSAFAIKRWDNIFVTLVFPVLWSVLYICVTILRFPSIARFDMMFVSTKVMILSERLLGSFGLSFIILWIISLITFSVNKHRKNGYIIALLLSVAVLGIGTFYYVNRFEKPMDSIAVAYTMGPYCGSFTDYEDVDYEVSVACMQKAVQNAALKGAKILAFNEEAFALEETQKEEFINLCCDAAKENNLVMLIGLDVTDTDESDGGKSSNLLVLIDQYGEVQGSYSKYKLIPIIESDYVAGNGDIPSSTLNIDGKSVVLSYLICYDSNFPEYVKKIDDNTDILILPSWDWDAVTQLHSLICRTIAIENQVSVLKPTYDGKSVAIGPNGNVIYKSNTSKSGYEEIHVVNMPIKAD